MPTSRGSRSLRTFVMLFVVPVFASALIAWWLIGDVSERGGYLQILPLPSGDTAAAGAGVVGAVFALAFLRELWEIQRTGRIPSEAIRLTASAVVLGVFTAFVRVLSSKTDGANIGGGMLMILGPVLAVPLLVYGVRKWRTLE